jgi:hypothetical protein
VVLREDALGLQEYAMRGFQKLIVSGVVLSILAGCGHDEPGRMSGGTAGGAATGAVIGLVGGPIGVVLGAGIGAGVGAMTSANTTPGQVDLGKPVWNRSIN